MTLPVENLSSQQLRTAADLKEQIDALQTELNDLLGLSSGPGYVAAPKLKRRMSRAGRAAIAAAAKARWARWAKLRGNGSPAAPKPHRRMSAAAKARMSAIAKARWKKAKATGKTTL